MENREKVINGCKYTLKSYGHPEQTIIDDASWDTVTRPDGTIQLQRKVGTYQSEVIFYSLVSWDIKDAQSNVIPLNRENFKNFFPKNARLALFEEAIEINELGEEEKNLSSGSSVKK